MAKENTLEQLGGWLFILGIVIAVLAGLFAAANPTLLGVMAVLGLIVGVLNVTDKEMLTFLVAAIALLVASGAMTTMAVLLNATFAGIGTMVAGMFGMLAVFVGGAVIIPALKAIYNIASSK